MTDKNRNLKMIEPDEISLLLQEHVSGTFNDMIGFEVLRYENGYCLSRTAIRPEFLNPLGGVHGGFLYTIADTTAGISSIHMGDVSSVTTVDGSLQFLRPALNLTHIYCESEMIKDGKRIAFTDVKLMSEDGTLLAKGSFTFARIVLPHVKMPKTEDLNDERGDNTK